MIFDVHVHVMLLMQALCRIIAYMCPPFFCQGTSPCLQPTVIEDTLITVGPRSVLSLTECTVV